MPDWRREFVSTTMDWPKYIFPLQKTTGWRREFVSTTRIHTFFSIYIFFLVNEYQTGGGSS
jgi:hypothetical protein